MSRNDPEIRIVWKGKDVTDAVQRNGKEGLQMAGDVVLSAANEIVPHDTGLLQSTGKVDVDGQKLEATVSYNTPYAVKVHEHPEWHFRNGRKGKWLEMTIKSTDIASAAQRAIADKLRDAFK